MDCSQATQHRARRLEQWGGSKPSKWDWIPYVKFLQLWKDVGRETGRKIRYFRRSHWCANAVLIRCRKPRARLERRRGKQRGSKIWSSHGCSAAWDNRITNRRADSVRFLNLQRSSSWTLRPSLKTNFRRRTRDSRSSAVWVFGSPSDQRDCPTFWA